MTTLDPEFNNFNRLEANAQVLGQQNEVKVGLTAWFTTTRVFSICLIE